MSELIAETTPGPWHVVYDTSRQDENGNGPLGICISIYEDDTCDALAWIGEGTAGDAEIMAAAPELASALRGLYDFGLIDVNHKYFAQSKAAFEAALELLKRVGF